MQSLKQLKDSRHKQALVGFDWLLWFPGLSVANQDSEESNELQKIHGFIFKYFFKKKN